jgi:NAD+ diphosphatase
MREEAGIEVTDATYLGSQSWPFPSSLMLGFSARAVGDSVKADGVEIEKLRWFSREELAAEAHEILLPTRLSIARAIIERWYGQKIDSATELS